MTSTKRVETKVTNLDLIQAQGGVFPGGISYRLTVECPASYDVDEITAEDIVHDAAIVVVD